MIAATEFTRFCNAVRRLEARIARRNRVKFPGICADAVVLGVSRIHLWLVLTGSRRSLTLTRRYRALKRSGGRAKFTNGKETR